MACVNSYFWCSHQPWWKGLNLSTETCFLSTDLGKNCKNLSALWCMKKIMAILWICIKLVVAVGKNADLFWSLFSLSDLPWKEITDIGHFSCLQKPDSKYSVVWLIYISKQTFLLPAILQLSLSLFQPEIIKFCQHCSCIARPHFSQNWLFQSTVDKEVESHHRIWWISSHRQKTYLPVKIFPANTTDLEHRF